MSAITPDAVREYLNTLRRVPHPELDIIAAEGRRLELPIVEPQTGALLHLLTRALHVTRALEIGTAIGYSAMWIATALPQAGRLISLERDESRAARAREHFVAAGVAERVTVITGDATRYLHKVSGPFDLIFQDGDKSQYEPMLSRLVDLLRPGGVLITDNVLWSGEVIPGYIVSSKHRPEDTAAIATYNQKLATDPSVYTTFLSTGDGVAVSTKL